MDPPAEARVPLQDQNAVPRAPQLAGRREPRDPGPDDDDGASPASLRGPVPAREGGPGRGVEGGVVNAVADAVGCGGGGGGGVLRLRRRRRGAVPIVVLFSLRRHPRSGSPPFHRPVDPEVDEPVSVQEPPRGGDQRRAALRRALQRRGQGQGGPDVFAPQAQDAVPCPGVGGDRGARRQGPRGNLVVRERGGREAESETRGRVEGDVVGAGGRGQRGEEARDVNGCDGDYLSSWILIFDFRLIGIRLLC